MTTRGRFIPPVMLYLALATPGGAGEMAGETLPDRMHAGEWGLPGGRCGDRPLAGWIPPARGQVETPSMQIDYRDSTCR